MLFYINALLYKCCSIEMPRELTWFDHRGSQSRVLDHRAKCRVGIFKYCCLLDVEWFCLPGETTADPEPVDSETVRANKINDICKRHRSFVGCVCRISLHLLWVIRRRVAVCPDAKDRYWRKVNDPTGSLWRVITIVLRHPFPSLHPVLKHGSQTLRLDAGHYFTPCVE
jgi:hypothetical protein